MILSSEKALQPQCQLEVCRSCVQEPCGECFDFSSSSLMWSDCTSKNEYSRIIAMASKVTGLPLMSLNQLFTPRDMGRQRASLSS